MPETPRAEHLPPGYDEESPYEGEDLSEYPDWWRKNIEDFRKHELRPYRPPRFADGEYTPPVTDRLEADLGVTIQIRATDPREGDDWRIEVDGDPVADIGRERRGEGFTQYEMTTEEFERTVRSAVR